MLAMIPDGIIAMVNRPRTTITVILAAVCISIGYTVFVPVNTVDTVTDVVSTKPQGERRITKIAKWLWQRD